MLVAVYPDPPMPLCTDYLARLPPPKLPPGFPTSLTEEQILRPWFRRMQRDALNLTALHDFEAYRTGWSDRDRHPFICAGPGAFHSYDLGHGQCALVLHILGKAQRQSRSVACASKFDQEAEIAQHGLTVHAAGVHRLVGLFEALGRRWGDALGFLLQDGRGLVRSREVHPRAVELFQDEPRALSGGGVRGRGGAIQDLPVGRLLSS